MSTTFSRLAWGALDCVDLALHGRIITRYAHHNPPHVQYIVRYYQRLPYPRSAQ